VEEVAMQQRFISLLMFFVTICLLVSVEISHAVPNPSSINWRGSPNAFIISLYRGVLNRNPESRQVVLNWAGQITNQSSSRVKVFWAFVGSQEYKKSVWANQRRQYYIYRKSQRKSRYYKYFAAKYSQTGGQRIGGGPYTRGVAVALAGYYKAYYPKW
jgi:hypothetical protein